MKLEHVPTKRLRAMLAATEHTAGKDSVAAGILRRELARRRKRRALPGQRGGRRG